ncbi:MAG: GNAT family N-acetyltransferase [Gaiellales bacterium]
MCSRDSIVPVTGPAVTARRIDLALAAAWPAAEAATEGGWLLRANGGVTRRANSALALGASCDPEAVRRWFDRHGLPARVQLVPSSPPGLAGRLRGDGWQEGDGGCWLVTAPVDACSRLTASHALTMRDGPSPAWIDTWWAVSPRGGARERAIAEAILGRAPVPRGFVLASAPDGAPLGCALGVVSQGVLVIESCATLPEARRRGVCRTLVGGLGRWARSAGADIAALTVERDNALGCATWEALGFVQRGRVDYLVLT